jgi:prepilin-type processing-associated H-X9-DG protein
MGSDPHDDHDHPDEPKRPDDRDRPRNRDERARDRDDRDRPRDRDRDYGDSRRSGGRGYDDYDDRPRRRRSRDDYDDRPRKSGSSTLIIVLCVVGAVVVGGGALMFFAVQKVRDAASRAKLQNNLKQFAVGMYNYESANGHFPAPAICDVQGKPLLSWRVAILPYIEEAQLFQQFKLDEPWDSPNNKQLLASMPKIYAPLNNQAVADEHKTYYRVFYPKGEIGVGPTNDDLMNGFGNLVMIVEAGEPVLWTKPDELEYEVGQPMPALGGIMPESKTFNVAFFDGSVRAIPRNEAGTIKDMIRPKSVRLKR